MVVATPVLAPMVATLGLLDVHVAKVVRVMVDPVPVVPITVKSTVCPAEAAVELAGVMVSDTTSDVAAAALTMKVEALLTIVPPNPGALAVICEFPVAKPVGVATPELLMVTMIGAKDVQVTWSVITCVCAAWPGWV